MTGERSLTEGEYLLGLTGLAILRRRGEPRARVRELLALAGRLDDPELARSRGDEVGDVLEGYARWAEQYDDPGNLTVALEQPAVRSLLDELPSGPVLDAACGTGRHLGYLAESLGRRELAGVDASAAMLARARERVPHADLREADVRALPFADGAFSGVVCALALSHLPDLREPVAQLARVLAPGGRLIVSNPHPAVTELLGWRARFRDSEGRRGYIAEHPHGPSDYLDAFGAAGLTADACIEPRITEEQAVEKAPPGLEEAFRGALTGVPAAIVWQTVKPAGG